MFCSSLVRFLTTVRRLWVWFRSENLHKCSPDSVSIWREGSLAHRSRRSISIVSLGRVFHTCLNWERATFVLTKCVCLNISAHANETSRATLKRADYFFCAQASASRLLHSGSAVSTELILFVKLFERHNNRCGAARFVVGRCWGVCVCACVYVTLLTFLCRGLSFNERHLPATETLYGWLDARPFCFFLSF